MNLDVVIECIWCQWQWLRFHVSIKVEWPCLIYIADIGNVIYVTDKFMLSDWLLSLGWVPILQVNSEGKLFSAVLFEWTKRKHVPLPVIALNGKSKFAAIGSRLLFRPYIISIFPRTGTLLLPCNLVWQNRVCICQIQHQSCGNECPHASR